MEEVEEELLNGKQKAGNADQKLGTIVELAQREGGFGSDQTRRKIWRLLSEQFAETHMYEEVLSRPTFQDIISHKEFDQVQADVRRTLLRFPPNTTDSDRHELLEALTPLIIKVLIAYPEARYYQGFHDICLTVLLVLGPTDALFVSYNLAKNFFSRFLEQPMEYASEHLERIYMIVANEDWYLYDHLVSNEVPIIFALSWIITWFSHDLKHYESITRLFDFFMASHVNMPLYVAAAIVLSSRKMVITSLDSTEIFQILLHLPKSTDVESSIQEALRLYSKYPPDNLHFPERRTLVDFVSRNTNALLILATAGAVMTAVSICYFIKRFADK